MEGLVNYSSEDDRDDSPKRNAVNIKSFIQYLTRKDSLKKTRKGKYGKMASSLESAKNQ